MSRIHEALKKAEQARAASQGVQPEAGQAGDRPDMNPVAVLPGPGEPAPDAQVFSTRSPADPRLSRCAQATWHPDQITMLFFGADDHRRGTEEFRTLRSRLYQLREKMPLKKLLVSSALPKEGKSFVAANLAQVMVKQQGCRVLLIDGDLRGSRLHESLGTSPAPGLSEYLMREQDEFSIVQRGSMDNLFFIPSGRPLSSPAELVANGQFKFLLERLEPLFDWIVIDSPPAVPVSDATVLANFCDGVLMVVRSQFTPFDVARKVRLDFHDKQLIGVVLNGNDNYASAYSRYYQYADRTAKATGKGKE